MNDDLRAAVAAGALGSEESYRELLQSDRGGRAGDLRRQGLLGLPLRRALRRARLRSRRRRGRRGADRRGDSRRARGSPAGCSSPASRSSWRSSTEDPRFAREAAESTGFVPKGLMAVPLLHEDRALGVLEVLDRPQKAAFTLAEMELLGLFANEAAIALDLLQRHARRAPCWRPRAASPRRWLDSSSAWRTPSRSGSEAALQLLDAVEKLLRER